MILTPVEALTTDRHRGVLRGLIKLDQWRGEWGAPHPHTRAAFAAAWRRQSSPCGLTAGARPLTLRCADGGTRQISHHHRRSDRAHRRLGVASPMTRPPVPRTRTTTRVGSRLAVERGAPTPQGGGAEERGPTGREAGLRLCRGPGAARPCRFPPPITASQRDQHPAAARSNNSAGQILLRGRTPTGRHTCTAVVGSCTGRQTRPLRL